MVGLYLKPCPFCGKTELLRFSSCAGTREKWVFVECGCSARGPDVRTSVTDAWNEDAAAEWNNWP